MLVPRQKEHRLTDLAPPALAEMELHPVIAMAALERMPRAEIPGLIAQMLASPSDANIFMSLFHLFTIIDSNNFALEMLDKALAINTVYRIAGTPKPAIRLLALMGPGDTTDNTPLDYLIENTDIRLDLLYIVPGQPLPDCIPKHDVAIIALGESGKNKPLLETMGRLIEHWPRPVLNQPDRILSCSRDSVSQLLMTIPGLLIPATQRITRQTLEHAAKPGLPVSELPAYPITIRPIDSQGGRGLSKIKNADKLAAYLDAAGEQEFFVSSFIDYRSADGLFRKIRIALIDGLPYVSHLAISGHWVVHYKSAGMNESSAKRAEEADFMRDFDSGFVARHREALRAIAERVALDYVVIDCAETANGKLLIFEVDNRGWVHATDPTDIFPYKQEYMSKAFTAFRAMLLKKINTPNNPIVERNKS